MNEIFQWGYVVYKEERLRMMNFNICKGQRRVCKGYYKVDEKELLEEKKI